ncbi:hypothetical protein FACS1894187_04410 [Synergistales bacterium]|nr:hypothetical protein FACS1894187_04410 [Synergistales bacterium]
MKLFTANYEDGTQIVRFAKSLENMKAYAENCGGKCLVWVVNESDYEVVAKMFGVELAEIERI